MAASDVPLSHTALVNLLQGDGLDKDAARAAVADAQRRGWIEHDLVSGYVLGNSEDFVIEEYGPEGVKVGSIIEAFAA